MMINSVTYKNHTNFDWNVKILSFLLVPMYLFGWRIFELPTPFIRVDPFKIISITLIAYAFIKRDWKIQVEQSSKTGFFVLFVWIIWGVLTLFWSPDKGAGLAEILSIVVGSALIFCAACAGNQVSFLKGWIFSYYLSLIVAFWELITKNHLPGYYLTQINQEQVLSGSFVLSYFGNPNDYAAFIILSVPVFVYMQQIGLIKKSLPIALLSILVVLFFTSSRFAIITLAILGFIYIINYFWNSKRKPIILVFFSILSILAIFYSKPIFDHVYDSLGLGNGPDVSVSTRSAMILNGYNFMKDTFGIGVGAGGFESEIAAGRGPVDVVYYVNPHNISIELLSQYGLFYGALFFYFLFYLPRSVRSQLEDNNLRFIILIFPILYLISGSFSSSFIGSPNNWMALAFIFIYRSRRIKHG